MKSLLVLSISLAVLLTASAMEFEALNTLRSKTPDSAQAATVLGMVKRVVGARGAEFSVTVDSSMTSSGKDMFKIQTVGSQVQVSGTTGVAAAMGVYYYLKQYCDSQFTWGGENINLPSTLPSVPSPVVVQVLDKFRYYQNVCTVSYSSPFWDWPRWERHLDWMALSGINLPLAFTGQEAMFQRLYMNMGFTSEDLDAFFGGPAFLAWSRMGNIQGWGGPLPQMWITRKLLLQHQILQRMRDFGMIPVLPGFAGHVPAAITKLFPNANVSRLGGWARFNETYSYTYLLDFSDPLFETIGSQFIKLMQSEFGVDHIYNADTFNEMTPKSSSPDYLDSAGKAVFNAMLKGDPDAVWLMQGWLFLDGSFWKGPQINALVNSVPQGRMIILDLMSELSPQYLRTNSYYGQPFIWCMLHNFGGTMELFGALDNINEGPSFGRHFMANSTMVGLGLTMEGIFQNEVIYEFMMENAWRPQPRNVTAWISAYTKQRYGFTSPAIDSAWQLLKGSVYRYNYTVRYHAKTGFVKRPNIKPHVQVPLWYDPEQLYKAWDQLLLGAGQFKPNELFLYDLVDVTRNSLQVLSLKFYTEITDAFKEKDITALKAAGGKMVDLLTDMETLLASDRHFLLGNWIHDAIAYASDMKETFLLQNNARNQITIWGPDGEIVDYASKQWSGLFKDYYVPRWQFFTTWLVQLIQNNTKYDGYIFDKNILEQVEKPFTFALDLYATNTTGDSVAIAKQLHAKYRPITYHTFFRKMAVAATSPKKAHTPSPFSWQQKGHSRYVPLRNKQEMTFEEVRVRETIVVV
ncbi:alpha-N-acetylglucosaminidase-like isoform X3 [Littorina saxatilis]|uniref:alpha-N-acetylglucosaminidase-like isoform X3 n=1 Tax=Littorina saxatilis TaxID=31220 RepID=UPI0038B4D903